MNDIDLDALARDLGFVSKSEQKEAVGLFPKRRDVFAVLPTGFGKTLQTFRSNIDHRSRSHKIRLFCSPNPRVLNSARKATHTERYMLSFYLFWTNSKEGIWHFIFVVNLGLLSSSKKLSLPLLLFISLSARNVSFLISLRRQKNKSSHMVWEPNHWAVVL